MKRLAIFVEGQTEQLFVERLLLEIAGKMHISIECRQAFGGNKFPRRVISLRSSPATAEVHYYVLIIDSGTDNRVMSDVREQYQSLVQSDYQAIIALRDLHPLARSELADLERGLRYGIKTKPIVVDIIIAIMEVEAWFLAEHTHYEKIDPNLTVDKVIQALGFSPITDDMQLRDRPAQDLDNAYKLVKKSYDKSKTCVQETVEKLDYETVYMHLGQKLPSLNKLLHSLNLFLS